jgi:hypothetical protein
MFRTNIYLPDLRAECCFAGVYLLAAVRRLPVRSNSRRLGKGNGPAEGFGFGFGERSNLM